MTFRFTTLLLFGAALFCTLVLAFLPQPPAVPGRDKLHHMAAFGALTVLYAMSFPKRSVLAVAVPLAILGGVIELLQRLPFVGRDCDIRDWVADLIAIGAGLVIVGVWRAQADCSSVLR